MSQEVYKPAQAGISYKSVATSKPGLISETSTRRAPFKSNRIKSPTRDYGITRDVSTRLQEYDTYSGVTKDTVLTGTSKGESHSGKHVRSIDTCYVDTARVSDVEVEPGSHRVLTEEELATFRTSFCTKHHQNKCPNSDSCEKSHCLTWQRRNPFEVDYCPHLCPEIQFVKKSRKMVLYRRCTRGKNCNFAHSKEEELYHPLVYKTKQCSAYPRCSRYFCPFVHTPDELRDVSKFKGTLREQPSPDVPTVPSRVTGSPSDDATGERKEKLGVDTKMLIPLDSAETLKSSTLEPSTSLWYELPNMCNYDDLTFKGLYDEYGSFRVADDYQGEFDLQFTQVPLDPTASRSANVRRRQPVSKSGVYVDNYGMENYGLDYGLNYGMEYGVDLDNFGAQYVQYVSNDLDERFNSLNIGKNEDQTDDCALNDILVKFINEIGDK
ncbi:hypothetical protein BEWA_001580 [Theileria equi strain WA]|uniref:C3H1-type domain-containing protein n=1 Tax=Theileria equi strain WA TaxID=1537102 RepID=L0B0G1_THEEQ|nr:hypothetical protein BEWA_001580 [Theileria equi strain WA]AFZ80751.1 hypothetical protein BEWA_001580 [Theileria equi strain WA]|eukprot:XP_004830417.1 hypothetical protein BEWA_001580 [Theileria equi strain WA]